MSAQLLIPSEQDAINAAHYWRDREFKKYAVDVCAGPERKPTYRCTWYARARSGAAAIASVKRNAILPRQCRFAARLAGPRELGCVVT